MESSISDHLSRVQRHLKEGVLILRKIHEEGKVTPFQIPDAVPNETQLTYDPPRDGEWYACFSPIHALLLPISPLCFHS